MPPWANNASDAIERGMANITHGMWPKRKRRYHRRHEEWIWAVIIFAVIAWAAVWLVLEIVMIALLLIVVIAGGLHALALLVTSPLRRSPGNTAPPHPGTPHAPPEPPQKPTWPHAGHG
jgi:hypothetical protein